MCNDSPSSTLRQRLHDEIEALALISSHPAPAVTRVLFSPEDLEARAWLRERVLSAGFDYRCDAVGNQFISWPGSDSSLAPVATGSHIDAIPNAGKYDGVVGVLGGLEAMRQLKESGYHPTRTIELIVFTAEEPTRFGIGCLGSRMMAGTTDSQAASELRDGQGQSLDDLRPEHYSDSLQTVRLATGSYANFIELHIEQGPQLEESRIDIGIVEKIAAPAAFRLKLKGSGGHAGAVLMSERRDAFLAAAEIALRVERAALESSSPDTVGTTGVVTVLPGAINSIPCECILEIDFRDTDLAAREEALNKLKEEAHLLCQRRQVELTWSCINSDPPATCDQTLVALLEDISQQQGSSSQRMISRAYHDALFMARLCPITMIFIPCYRGYSHRPDEYASPEAIDKGVAVLAEALRRLSS